MEKNAPIPNIRRMRKPTTPFIDCIDLCMLRMCVWLMNRKSQSFRNHKLKYTIHSERDSFLICVVTVLAGRKQIRLKLNKKWSDILEQLHCSIVPLWTVLTLNLGWIQCGTSTNLRLPQGIFLERMVVSGDRYHYCKYKTAKGFCMR